MSQDFLSRLPDAHRDLSSKPSLFRRIHLDAWLLFLLLILMGSGLVILYSASGGSLEVVQNQAGRFGFALMFLFIVAQIPPRIMKRWALIVFVGTLLMLVAVLVLGIDAKGAQRWLNLGFIRLQPSELMKLILPLMLAAYLSDKHLPPSWKSIGVSMLILVVPVLLVAMQPDLGTAILISVAGILVLFLAGLSWRLIASLFALCLAALPVLWMLMHDYQQNRVRTFLNPESDPLGTGWNIIQSKTAIGSGGLFGKGWLEGTQSRLEFLPEKHTDFIIAVLAEEAGLIGVGLLLLLYSLIIWRGMFIAFNAEDTFSRLLASSIILTFFVYVFVNLGMVSGLLPVVGIPLPLVSYGGTASLAVLVGFGVLMSIHTHKSGKTK